MVYECIKNTPTLDRIEKISDKIGFGLIADQIRETRPGIDQRRQFIYDGLNDERADGTIIKAFIKARL